MKYIALIAAALISALTVSAQQVNTCDSVENKPVPAENPYLLMGGPGIVTSVSATNNQLPKSAQDFLNTYYTHDIIASIMHNVVKNVYNVNLADGTQITFLPDGRVDDIVAPGTNNLNADVIKAVIPEKAYNHLRSAGLLYEVTGISDATQKSMQIQLLNAMPPQLIYDVNGLFVIVDD